jgi:diacylglycerol kinase (ATP)
MRMSLATPAINVRITLIHNPGAGKEAMDECDLKELLRRAGHKVRYQSAKEPGWKKALGKPADLIVVAGGDGTVGRVTRRMPGHDVPVALLPMGTANNIARSLGQLERPFEELIRGWENARRLVLDVGVAEGPWGERYFVEGVGAGVFADLLAGSDPKEAKKLKKVKNPVEAGLRRLREQAERAEPVTICAELDGEDVSGEYLLFEALNLSYIGPNLFLTANAQPGDGRFELVMVTEAERSRLVYYLDHWQDDRDRLAILPSRSGSRLKVEWTGFPLHIDDKLQPKAKIRPKRMAGMVEARIDGAAVRFLVPDAKAA